VESPLVAETTLSRQLLQALSDTTDVRKFAVPKLKLEFCENTKLKNTNLFKSGINSADVAKFDITSVRNVAIVVHRCRFLEGT